MLITNIDQLNDYQKNLLDQVIVDNRVTFGIYQYLTSPYKTGRAKHEFYDLIMGQIIHAGKPYSFLKLLEGGHQLTSSRYYGGTDEVHLEIMPCNYRVNGFTFGFQRLNYNFFQSGLKITAWTSTKRLDGTDGEPRRFNIKTCYVGHLQKPDTMSLVTDYNVFTRSVDAPEVIYSISGHTCTWGKTDSVKVISLCEDQGIVQKLNEMNPVVGMTIQDMSVTDNYVYSYLMPLKSDHSNEMHYVEMIDPRYYTMTDRLESNTVTEYYPLVKYSVIHFNTLEDMMKVIPYDYIPPLLRRISHIPDYEMAAGVPDLSLDTNFNFKYAVYFVKRQVAEGYCGEETNQSWIEYYNPDLNRWMKLVNTAFDGDKVDPRLINTEEMMRCPSTNKPEGLDDILFAPNIQFS